MGQLLSLPMIIVGLFLMAYAYRRAEPSGNYGHASGGSPSAGSAASYAK